MVASVGYDLDVLVVGAGESPHLRTEILVSGLRYFAPWGRGLLTYYIIGFCGIYQLYLLRQQGFKVKLIDRASDVGGVWQWNRYPGAMSDSESYIYRYSWDKELLDSWELKNNYAKQSEILAYLQLVVERHNLREDMIFNTDLVGAQWNETSKKWEVETAQGVQFTTRYLVTGLGHFSKVNYPNINSLGSFQGDIYHTSRWPADCDLTGKRVAVLGNGSTGMQVICALGNDPKIAQLTSFQRTPQYTVPARDGPMDPKRKEEIKSSYDQIWDNVFHSKVGLSEYISSRCSYFGNIV
jgi:cation diffusion facilitator CzcD-associated flavoprotein CzcO